MKVLVTDKELAVFLYSSIDNYTSCLDIVKSEPNTAITISEFIDRRNGRKYDPLQDNLKFKDKLYKSVSRDLSAYVDTVNSHLKNRKNKLITDIQKHLNYIVDTIGEEKILNAFKQSKIDSFVKNVGLQIDPSAKFIRQTKYNNYIEDCLFRNMAGNESLLLNKIDNHLPFWFIDTGYTNFLSGKGKKWHRLVQNNLHHSTSFLAPVDRLETFERFPAPWRTSGEKILIIEPGEFSADTFKIDINQWKKDTEIELRKYTDKPIIFRKKLSKKVRKNLYEELCNDDYYCVININSNAAVESIWAGIPAITLHTHITNEVTTNKLSDINNLYRPHLANWLCRLSYSQFTYDELINGTAVNMLRKYHV